MDKRQDFIGGLVASILVKKGVEVAVERGIKAIAKEPGIDTKAATKIVAQSVAKEVEAQVQHQTNTEPVYKSRVSQGSLVLLLTAITDIASMWNDGIAQTPVDYAQPVTIIAGTLWILYGRFVAKKPFGA